MRYWQPIHHDRWHSFITGLNLALAKVGPATNTPAAELVSEALVSIAPAQEPVSEISSPPPAESAAVDDHISPATFLPDSQPIAEFEASSEQADMSPGSLTSESTLIVDADITQSTIPVIAPASFRPGMDVSSARVFFTGLDWSNRASHLSPSSTVAVSNEPPTESTAKQHAIAAWQTAASSPLATISLINAASFFSQLPWSGSSHYGDVVTTIHVTANRDDSGLNPRTADLPNNNPLIAGMLSAARTSDRMAARPATPVHARAFFTSLPWAHT